MLKVEKRWKWCQSNRTEAFRRLKLLLAPRSGSQLKQDWSCSTVWSYGVLESCTVRTLEYSSVLVFGCVFAPVCCELIFPRACTLYCFWVDAQPWKTKPGVWANSKKWDQACARYRERERERDVKSVEFVGDLLTVPGVRALQKQHLSKQDSQRDFL